MSVPGAPIRETTIGDFSSLLVIAISERLETQLSVWSLMKISLALNNMGYSYLVWPAQEPPGLLRGMLPGAPVFLDCYYLGTRPDILV